MPNIDGFMMFQMINQDQLIAQKKRIDFEYEKIQQDLLVIAIDILQSDHKVKLAIIDGDIHIRNESGDKMDIYPFKHILISTRNYDVLVFYLRSKLAETFNVKPEDIHCNDGEYSIFKGQGLMYE